MAEKIKITTGTKVTENDIIDLLIKGANNDIESKLIVLFPDSKTKSKISSSVGDRIKQEPAFVIDRQKALTIKNNMLRANNIVLYLGLTIDEPLLVSSYDQSQIRYYDKGEN